MMSLFRQFLDLWYHIIHRRYLPLERWQLWDRIRSCISDNCSGTARTLYTCTRAAFRLANFSLSIYKTAYGIAVSLLRVYNNAAILSIAAPIVPGTEVAHLVGADVL